MLQKKSVLIVLLAAGLLLSALAQIVRQRHSRKERGCVNYRGKAALCGALKKIDGVGEVYALLSEEPNRRGEYTGAVVVCSGARSPDIRFRVIQAVSAFTGLGSDRIIVEELIS